VEEIIRSNKIGFLPEFHISDIKWNSPSMKKIIQTIPAIAPSKSRVLIRGEIGTGKTMIAKMIHNSSKLRDLPFLSFDSVFINELKLNDDIISDKSAQLKLGNLSGDIGTLFFRNIETLSLENQYKIYYLIKKWEHDGYNFRIIASIKSTIWAEIKRGNFIEEFYYYLNVINIHVLPLRERLEDIEPLVSYLSKMICKKLNCRRAYFKPEEISKLYNLQLKGNMLEVANLVERTIVLSPESSKNLTFSDLQIENVNQEDYNDYKKDFSDHKENFLKKTIIDAIKRNSGVKKEAAKHLGISQRALSYYISKYNIPKIIEHTKT